MLICLSPTGTPRIVSQATARDGTGQDGTGRAGHPGYKRHHRTFMATFAERRRPQGAQSIVHRLALHSLAGTSARHLVQQRRRRQRDNNTGGTVDPVAVVPAASCVQHVYDRCVKRRSSLPNEVCLGLRRHGVQEIDQRAQCKTDRRRTGPDDQLARPGAPGALPSITTCTAPDGCLPPTSRVQSFCIIHICTGAIVPRRVRLRSRTTCLPGAPGQELSPRFVIVQSFNRSIVIVIVYPRRTAC